MQLPSTWHDEKRVCEIGVRNVQTRWRSNRHKFLVSAIVRKPVVEMDDRREHLNPPRRLNNQPHALPTGVAQIMAPVYGKASFQRIFPP
jgi:hypothetical protein